MEFFEKEVRPVLAEHCYSCHSSKAKTRFAGLRLDSRLAVTRGSDAGPVIIAGKPSESRLVQVLRGKLQPAMPPSGKLPEAKIAAIEKWITDGAAWPEENATAALAAASFNLDERRREHWAWRPVRKPAIPDLPGDTWSRQPLDRFLLSALRAKGLAPASAADRRTWIRRVTFDLTGLPPAPEEVRAFESDQAEGSFERVVDRLLASPRFAEHWARHWMDLVRYAESHGSEGDPDVPEAWQYRDYLIRAFQKDVPYDQLVREHLAGDLLARPRVDGSVNESMLGIGHLRMVEHGFQPVDPWEDRVKWADNQVDVIAKTFQGLTVSCARCHDHKFDAISQRDYYALFGVLAGARPTQRAIDAPGVLDSGRDRMLAIKSQVREKLADLWQGPVSFDPNRAYAAETPLAVWKELKEAPDFPAAWNRIAAHWRNEIASRQEHNRQFRPAFDVRKDFNAFVPHGVNVQAVRPGEFFIPPDGERVVNGIYPGGAYTHLLSNRHPGVFSTPRFKIESDYLSFRLLGGNFGSAQLIIENYAVPRGGIYHMRYSAKSDQMQWASWDTTFWKGFTAYVEFSTLDDQTHFILDDEDQRKKPQPKPERNGRSWIGAQSVVLHDRKGKPKEIPQALTMLFDASPRSLAEFEQLLHARLRESVAAWRRGDMTEHQADFLDAFVRAGVLPSGLPALGTVATLVDEYRRLESAIPKARRAPGVVDDQSPDQPLLVRGNHKVPGELVPRGYLTALGGKRFSRDGRLHLAAEIASPSNPLTARVLVNRLWARFFGRGIVRSVDNFGKLGDRPTHPELLDWMAARFVEDGWSMKKMIRLMVTSSAYRMSTDESERARETDPANLLLQHMPVRRLEAESIRDSILAVSGRLDPLQYGPSINVYYDHDQGKTKGDRPKGPLDGAGRRSIYLEVRRNATNPFLEVFDFPKPATTRGERDLTNVPAQSLALLNGMFVIEQATRWAETLVKEEESPKQRIDRMFWTALGRPATSKEIDLTQSFVADLAAEHNAGDAAKDVRVWRDVAQSLFNLKEFLYVR